MDMTDVKLFNAELSGMYDNKPPISKAKMSAITRTAIKAIKFYKHVVHSVEKFILKCKPEYKVPGLYVIDSIVRQSRHQFGQEKDVFAPRFAKNMQQTFANLFRCPPEDKRNIIRVLNLWQKNNVFSPEVIQPLLDMADPNHPIHQEILQSNSANGSVLHQSGMSGEHKSSPAMQQGQHTPQRATPNEQHSYSQSQQSGSGGKFKRLLNDFEYESEEEGASVSETAHQPPPSQPLPPTSEALGNILTNPEILRQLQSLQAQMNMMAGMQGLPNLLPQLSEIQLPGTLNNSIPFLGSQHEMPKNLDTNEDNTNNESDIEFVEQGPQVIEIDANDSRSPTPSRSRRRRSRSRSGSRRSHSRRKSRSRSRERDSRWDRRRDKDKERDRGRRDREDREREKEKEKEREMEREREKEREKKGLPPIKRENLSVCSTTLWVGHLSKLASAEDLSDVFGAIGGVMSIDVVAPRGCAFVVMERRRDAAKALAKLDKHKLHSKEITVAWAPGKGVKGREWKDYWESEWGVSYLPWDKLEQQWKLGLVNFELLEEGGMFDEDTYPPWMPPRLLPPKSLMEGLPSVMVPPGGMVPPMGMPPGGIPLPPGLGMPPVSMAAPGNIPLPTAMPLPGGGGKPPAMGLPPSTGAMGLPPTSAAMSLPNAEKMPVPSGPNIAMPARPNIPMPLGMPPPAIAARLGLPTGLPPGLAPRVPTGAGTAMPSPASLLGFPPGLPPQAGMLGGFLSGLGLPLGLGMGGVPMIPPHLLAAHQHNRQLNQASESVTHPDDAMDMDLDTEENALGEEHGGDVKSDDGAASAVLTLPDQLQALLSQPPPNFNFTELPPSVAGDGSNEQKEDELRGDGDRGRDKERERDRDRRDRGDRDRDRRDRKDRDRDRDRRDRDRGRERDRDPREDRRDRKDGDRDRKEGDTDRRDGERDRRHGERDRREGERERRDGDRDRRDGDRDRRDGDRDRGRDKRDRERDRWSNRAQSRDKTQASEGGSGEKTLQERLWEMANGGSQPLPEEPMEAEQHEDRADQDDRDSRHGRQPMLDDPSGNEAEGEDGDREGGWTQLPPARLLPQPPQPAFRADLRMRGPNRGPIRGPWMDESLGPRFNGGPPFNRPPLVGNMFDGAPRFDRPPFNRMPFDGPMRPPFDGPRPPFDGPRPPFEGMRMPFDGPRPMFDGPRPPFDGPRPPFDGFRPPFDGPRPRFDGPRPPFDGPMPPFDGPRPQFDGPPRFDGSRPEFFDRNNRPPHFENDRDFNERGGWKGDRQENEREWDHRRNERQGDWDDRRREKRSRDDERHQDDDRNSRDRDKRWNRDDRERGDREKDKEREKDKDNSKERRGRDRERKSSRWATESDMTTEGQPEMSKEALEQQQAAINTAMSIISKFNESAPVEEHKSENSASAIEGNDVSAPSLYDENEVNTITTTESFVSETNNLNKEQKQAGEEKPEQIIQAFNAKCDNSFSDNQTNIFNPERKDEKTKETLEQLETTEIDSVYKNVNNTSNVQGYDINTESKTSEEPTNQLESTNIFKDASNDSIKDRDLLDDNQYSFEPAISNQIEESIQKSKAALEKESFCDESKVSENVEGSEQTAHSSSGDTSRDADDVTSESVEEAATTSEVRA